MYSLSLVGILCGAQSTFSAKAIKSCMDGVVIQSLVDAQTSAVPVPDQANITLQCGAFGKEQNSQAPSSWVDLVVSTSHGPLSNTHSIDKCAPMVA